MLQREEKEWVKEVFDEYIFINLGLKTKSIEIKNKIDAILKVMNNKNSEFLKNVFIEKHDKYWLSGYCKSYYYKKLNNSIKEFKTYAKRIFY